MIALSVSLPDVARATTCAPEAWAWTSEAA